MGRTVEDLSDEISYDEMLEWAYLYRTDPWGERRADLRAAIGHSLFANANRDPEKRPEPFTPADFMPYEQPQRNDGDEGGVIAPETLTFLFAKAKRG